MKQKNKNKKTILLLIALVALFVIAYTFYKEYHDDIINTDIKEPLNNILDKLK